MAVHNASELRHRVSFQRLAEERFDKDGYQILDGSEWMEVRKVWALARDVSGKEFMEAYATQMLNIVTFETRAIPGLPIDNDWSIVFRGRRHEIIHINHRDYRGQWWEIKAREVRAESREEVPGDGE